MKAQTEVDIHKTLSFFQLGAKMEMDVQRHAPAALLPGTALYQFDRMLGGIQGQSGQVREMSPDWDSIFGPSRP